MNMEFLAKLFHEGKYTVVVVILCIYAILNADKIFDFHHKFKKKRIKLLLEAVNNKDISDTLKKHLLQQIDVEYFYITHGVRVSYPMLNLILNLNLKIGKSISFRHLLNIAKIGLDFTTDTDKDYRVKLSRSDYFMCIFSLISGLFIILLGFLSLLISLFNLWVDFNAEIMAAAILQAVLFISVGLFIIKDFMPILSAKYINDALDNAKQS